MCTSCSLTLETKVQNLLHLNGLWRLHKMVGCLCWGVDRSLSFLCTSVVWFSSGRGCRSDWCPSGRRGRGLLLGGCTWSSSGLLTVDGRVCSCKWRVSVSDVLQVGDLQTNEQKMIGFLSATEGWMFLAVLFCYVLNGIASIYSFVFSLGGICRGIQSNWILMERRLL